MSSIIYFCTLFALCTYACATIICSKTLGAASEQITPTLNPSLIVNGVYCVVEDEILNSGIQVIGNGSLSVDNSIIKGTIEGNDLFESTVLLLQSTKVTGAVSITALNNTFLKTDPTTVVDGKLRVVGSARTELGGTVRGVVDVVGGSLRVDTFCTGELNGVSAVKATEVFMESSSDCGPIRIDGTVSIDNSFGTVVLNRTQLTGGLVINSHSDGEVEVISTLPTSLIAIGMKNTKMLLQNVAPSKETQLIGNSDSITVLGSRFKDISVLGNEGSVILADNTITGNATLAGNRASTIFTSNSAGQVAFSGNIGATQITINTIDTLECQDNNPAPFLDGNTVRNSFGQCIV